MLNAICLPLCREKRITAAASAICRLRRQENLAHSWNSLTHVPEDLLTRPTSARLYREVFSKQALLALVGRAVPEFPAERNHSANHHLAHAASAHFTSGFTRCLVTERMDNTR